MSAPELFCFRCAAPMTRVAAELTCTNGGMGLSRQLEASLLRRFGAKVSAEAAPPARSGTWYCPACRRPLPDSLACSVCGETLGDLRHALVELHPHRNV